ncbi:kinase-like protein [Fomitiporia mediterranea MF3/22]|uniref:kinase-like protein n=1 Tax=Fomitiporia mediterranea (strain MF3/22) TaxID=694068 RepID=UPI0004407655|nr:kinase-like protein [Fomitiporia mediterranea MF3/22]EJD07112.1 kinase-like protein [Fomitiporia mediterranea MF3/22]
MNAEVLSFSPAPGLEEAGRVLLTIWDSLQHVETNRLACLRLTERCADILLSIREEIFEAGDQVGEGLTVPIQKLVLAFKAVRILLEKQAHKPSLKRFLERDDVLRGISRCDAALSDALSLFSLSIQIRTLRELQVAATQRRVDTETLIASLVPQLSEPDIDAAPNKKSIELAQEPNWTITRYEVNLQSKLGSGYFSEVHRARWREQTVAVKILTLTTPWNFFISEMAAWWRLRHPNVVRLLGANSAKSDPPWFLVSPFMKNGNLIDYMRSSEQLIDGPFEQRAMHEIAKGMEYLHQQGVIHGALKGTNVLIDDDGRCVLSDFGQSEMKSEVYRLSSTPPRGALRWRAPEIIDESFPDKVTRQVDVYAYAIVCVEILGHGTLPWGDVNDDTYRRLVVEEDKRPSIAFPNASKSILAIIDLCWQRDPSIRPTFQDIVCEIENPGSSKIFRGKAKLIDDDSERNQSQDGPDSTLQRTLAKLTHLDLTGRVQYNTTVMHANGGYCDVFVGTIPTLPHEGPSDKSALILTSKVAVKRMRIHIYKERDFDKLFAKELYVWSKLKHPNILPLRGFALEGAYPLVISEWMENGTLREYLQVHPNCNAEPMIVGIAKGLDYLHGLGIIHGDLKADNVLISSHGEPLICDFGISKMLSASLTIAAASSGGMKGSLRWMAYELFDLSSNGQLTKESDIWAFGMTVYEVLSRELPYARFRNDMQVMHAIIKHVLPSCPAGYDSWSHFLKTMWKICESCWILPPENRITIIGITNFLHSSGYTNAITGSTESGHDAIPLSGSGASKPDIP